MQCKRLSSNKYIVESDSGESYAVSLSGDNKDQISCECKGFKFRRNCKHVELIISILREKEGKTLKTKALPPESFDFLKPYQQDIIDVVNDFKEFRHGR